MSSLCNAKYKNISQKKSWESVNTWMWHNNTSSLVCLVQIHINKQSHGYEKFSSLLFSNQPLKTTKTSIWEVHSLKVTLAGDRGQWGIPICNAKRSYTDTFCTYSLRVGSGSRWYSCDFLFVFVWLFFVSVGTIFVHFGPIWKIWHSAWTLKMSAYSYI